MSEDPTARFAALVARHGSAVPLDEAALLIAAHAVPSLDLRAQQARLDDIAASVREPTVDALRDRLVDDLGFAGDQTTYGEPANSLLPAVLNRRQGIPLTLAVVAMEVGRRCGVPLLGVGMPGHFLVRPAASPNVFIDLFNGSFALNPSACRTIFTALHPDDAWDDSFLEPVTHLTMVSRLLTNLIGAYRRSGDRAALTWAIDLRLRVPGASVRDRRELALLHGAAGQYASAASLLEGTGASRDLAAAARMRARLN